MNNSPAPQQHRKKGKILLTQLRHTGRYSHLLSLRLYLPHFVVLGHTISVVRRTSTLGRREGGREFFLFNLIYILLGRCGREFGLLGFLSSRSSCVGSRFFVCVFFWLRIWVSWSEWILVSMRGCVDLGGILIMWVIFWGEELCLGIWVFVSVGKIWVFRLTYCRVESGAKRRGKMMSLWTWIWSGSDFRFSWKVFPLAFRAGS